MLTLTVIQEGHDMVTGWLHTHLNIESFLGLSLSINPIKNHSLLTKRALGSRQQRDAYSITDEQK